MITPKPKETDGKIEEIENATDWDPLHIFQTCIARKLFIVPGILFFGLESL